MKQEDWRLALTEQLYNKQVAVLLVLSSQLKLGLRAQRNDYDAVEMMDMCASHSFWESDDLDNPKGITLQIFKQFVDKFHNIQLPNRGTVRNLVIRSRETGSLDSKIRRPKRRVLTDARLDDTGASLERSTNKSVRRVAQEVGVSKTSAHTATKLLKWKSYGVTVDQELRPHDEESNFVRDRPYLLVFRTEPIRPLQSNWSRPTSEELLETEH
ncbi:hypothetical protein ANN_13523 [Periplaneta americana]|uniref:Uncharacterized protein n=1 Tax=Periplaneta americana TaxID=6978 RepID=A0ABQ8TM24_PERAM|nr:hypothetical protein ANN_13523 [Periplaneta americana]